MIVLSLTQHNTDSLHKSSLATVIDRHGLLIYQDRNIIVYYGSS